MVTTLTCIWDVLGVNIDWNTIFSKIFTIFLSLLRIIMGKPLNFRSLLHTYKLIFHFMFCMSVH